MTIFHVRAASSATTLSYVAPEASTQGDRTYPQTIEAIDSFLYPYRLSSSG